MKIKYIALFLCFVLLVGVCVPGTMAAENEQEIADTPEACTVCGQTDGHTADCATRCSCGESKPEAGHLETCELYTCTECGALLNQGQTHNAACSHYVCTECGQTGGHTADCATRCSCGESKPEAGHLETCELYTCTECGALLNQGQTHNTACSHYVCTECGQTGGTHSDGCSAVQAAPAASEPCAVCGMTDGHTLTCSTLCSCGATGEEHQSTCKLYECVDCGRMINQEDHEINCPTRCTCGDQKPDDGTHLGVCPLYSCPTEGCATYPNQGMTHDMYCEFYACPVCGVLVWQPDTVLTDGCICHYASMCLGCDTVEENTYIAFPDKSQANLTMFNRTVEEFGYEYGISAVPSSAFPNYVIINRQYYMDGQLKFYELDSFSAEFNDNTLGYYYYMEPRFFSAVVPAAGLYATVGGAENIELLTAPNVTDGAVTVAASALGEYVVADFSYEYLEAANSYIKLTPDANWPAAAEYCWLSSDYITNLSLTATQSGSSGPLTDPDAGIVVQGGFPNGTTLNVRSTTLAEILPYVPYLEGISNPHVVYDITLNHNGSVWQPGEGDSVTVNMDVSALGDGNDSYLIYHIHPNGDGTADVEVKKPLSYENGTISFTMNRFSYVLVLNSSTEISNVSAFYPVQSYIDSGVFPIAGNGYWCIVGVYVGTDGSKHILLGQVGNGSFQTKKIDYVTVDGVQYENNASLLNYKGTNITEIKLSGTGGTVTTVIDFSNSGNVTQGLLGYLDINLGSDVILGEQFDLSLRATTGQEGNSFNIAGVKVDLHLEYSIRKTVSSVGNAIINADRADAAAGDWVTFEIEIANGGTSNTDLSGAVLSDVMPTCFDHTTVQWSSDGMNWTSTVPAVNELAPGTSQTVYVKARIPEAFSTADGTEFTNKANLTVPDQPTAMDEAVVVIHAPVAPSLGNLTITKELVGRSDDIADEEKQFTFTIVGSDVTLENGTVYGDYTVADNALTVSISGSGSVTLEGLPVGSYTVTETASERYTTTVDGAAGTAATVTIQMGETSEVAFTNTYKRADLVISKSVNAAKEGGALPEDSFTFTFAVDTNGAYAIEGSAATISNGQTFTLSGGESIKIVGLPVGAVYSVTETPNASYATSVDGVQGSVASGTLAEDGAKHGFLNVLQPEPVGSLMITKTLEGRTDDLTEEELCFTFIVTGDTLENGAVYSGVTAQNGALSFTIVGSGNKILSGLPLGIYTVSESTVGSFVTTVNGAAGSVGTAEVTEGATAEVNFVNTYERTSLTITKSYDGMDLNQSAVFTVTTSSGYRTTVIIPDGAGSATITGLKVGDTVTITENKGWVWRYSVSNDRGGGITAQFVLDADTTKNTVTFTNTRSISKWLSGENFAVNKGGSGIDVTHGEGGPVEPTTPPVGG